LLLNKRYEILSKIGQGAVAEVFKARDALLNTIVALKIAKPNPVYEEKIATEFRITTQFEHPNIISAYDFGTVRICEDQKLLSRKFIVLEYCDTQDIIKYLSNAEFKDKIKIMYQICHAVHTIHKAKLVHRDLKPENILFDSTTSRIKITDLGLAIGQEQINFDELPAGTLYYLAPEILQGSKFDHRADIYSLGILFYYILNGKLPFDTDEPVEILKWHLSPRHIDFSNIPEEVQKLLNSMLEPDPSHRPQNLVEVMNLLKTLMPDLPEIKNFKVRKPFGKDEALKKAIEILKTATITTGKITLITGADGIGKTSLLRYISAEAKLLGFETILINEINIQKTLNLILKSPLASFLTPELKMKAEKLKEEKILNYHTVIEFSEFLEKLLSDASNNFPLAIFIDALNPSEPLSEIFIKSILLSDKLKRKNIAIFIACETTEFITFIAPEVEKIYLRPLNTEELKNYLYANFDFDPATAQELAEMLSEYTGGISAVLEIFSNYLQDKIDKSTIEISKIANLEFDAILNRIKQLNSTQREILDILSLASEPVEIEILSKFFNYDISAHLYQLQSFGFIKIENEKVSIAYKALKKHIESDLDEEVRKRFHLNYALAYYDEDIKNADKVLYHFAKMGDSEGVSKFAEIGIENLISKGEFKKAINLCQEIFELLPGYLKTLFKIKLGFIHLQLGNYKDAISTLEDLDELEAFELKAEAYFHLGDTNKAIEILKHTFKMYDTLYEKIRIATKISQILASIGDIDTALILLESFENKRILSFIEKTDVLGDLYAGLGIIFQMKGYKEKAKIYFELSLEHRLKKQNQFKLIAGYNNIANFYSINGKYDEAITYWKKALEISKSTGNIVQSAHIYNNIGVNQFKRNNYEKALENYQKALAIYRAINDVHGVANVLGNIGELMIEEFKLGEAYKHIKEAKELHIKTNNLDGLLETDLLLLSLYLVAGDIKNAELTLNEINQKHPETPPELIECYRACIEMKKKNFAESESILMKLLNNENIKGNDDIYLKILISLLKLNYVTGGIEKLEMVRSIAENYAEQVENFNLKALLFFLISLSYEDKDKSLAVKYLNKSIESLGYEFFEPKWKIYLMLAQNYKRRGIESKFLQSFETALINFQELLQRIETPEFVKSYLADVENEKFLKILQNLKI